jgi:hypothetical protein
MDYYMRTDKLFLWSFSAFLFENLFGAFLGTPRLASDSERDDM